VLQPAKLKRTVRWAFLVLGFFLIIRADLVLTSVYSARPLFEFIFPDARSQNIALAVATIVVLSAGLLSLATAWGLDGDSKWGRWTGLLASIALLPAWPWFSAIGFAGILVILTAPLDAKQQQIAETAPPAPPVTDDYWTQAKTSNSQAVLIALYGAFVIAGVNGAFWLAEHEGLPEFEMGWHWWLYLAPLALINTAIHELGHALVAWTLHHRIRVISIGPFTWSRTHHGKSFETQWKRLLDSSGYMGSVPRFREHLRLQLIAVIAGGPISSAFVGLLMLALFLGYAGPRWQQNWEVVSLCGVIGFSYAIIGMIPLGYSDGSMLFHLAFRTHAGQLLLDGSRIAQIGEDAELCQQQADFEKNLALKELMLRHAAARSQGNSMMLAICLQSLGYAKLVFEDWPGAERELRKCLEFEAECAANTPLRANALSLLHCACVERHNVDESIRLYTRALEVLSQRKAENRSLHLAVTTTMLAQLHERAGYFDEALREATNGLHILPHPGKHDALRAMLHAVDAQCQTCCGRIEIGIHSARTAASIVRSKQLPVGERNLAWNRISELGDILWRAGQPAIAIELLREAIANLESANAKNAAARQKIKLAAILRQLGKTDEATGLLPQEDGLPVVLRRYLLAERANIHLSLRHSEIALADLETLIELWRAEPDAKAETALAQSLLAAAYLELGNDAEAEMLAGRAIAVLEPWKHYEAMRCRVTLALAHLRMGRPWAATGIEVSVEQIHADPLLRTAEKVRVVEAEAIRLEQYGRTSDAQCLRQFAADLDRAPIEDSRTIALSPA